MLVKENEARKLLVKLGWKSFETVPIHRVITVINRLAEERDNLDDEGRLSKLGEMSSLFTRVLESLTGGDSIQILSDSAKGFEMSEDVKVKAPKVTKTKAPKAEKAEKPTAVKEPKASKTAPVENVTTGVTKRVRIFDRSATDVIQWATKEGWTFAEVRQLLNENGAGTITDNSIRVSQSNARNKDADKDLNFDQAVEKKLYASIGKTRSKKSAK